jgi:peptidoglycan/LPS O-acetylase OafA/YrhL
LTDRRPPGASAAATRDGAEAAVRLLANGEEAGTAPDDRPFRPDVEGLRAVAVLLVVLYHAGVPRLTGGYVGVDVFFVISGFVITGLLLRERQATDETSIVAFYARRMRRILPAATLVIAAAVVGTFIVLGTLAGVGAANDGRWAAAFLANFHFESVGTSYLSARLPPSPLQNYWSLSVEEQFYVVYPTLFLVIASIRSRLDIRARLAMVLIGIIALSYWLSVAQTAAHPTAAYFSPFTRAWELALGGLVAVGTPWIRRLPPGVAGPLTWFGLAAVVYSAFAFNSHTVYPGALVEVPVVGTALIIAGGVLVPRWGAESLLGPRPVQWLGRRSYSLYLWHWPILVLAAERLGRSQLTARQNLPYLVVALLASMATYSLIEDPIRHRRWPARQTVVAGVGLVVTTIVLLTVVIHLEAGGSPESRVVPAADQGTVVHAVASATRITSVPSDLSPSLAGTRRDFAGLNNPEFSCVKSALQGTDWSRSCTLGDAGGKHLLVVYGDSHALMWLPAFQRIAVEAHWRLEVLVSYYCPAELVTVGEPASLGASGEPNTQCTRFHTWAVDRIHAERPDLVVISQSTLYSPPTTAGQPGGLFSASAWGEGLHSLLRELRTPPGRVVFLGDIPALPSDPPTCLSEHLHDVQACSAPVAVTRSGFTTLERGVVTGAGSRYVDPTPWFCSDVCTPIVDHYGVYRDQLHMTGTYALYLEKVLGAALGLP